MPKIIPTQEFKVLFKFKGYDSFIKKIKNSIQLAKKFDEIVQKALATKQRLISFQTFKKHCNKENHNYVDCLGQTRKCDAKNCPVWRRLK